MKTKILCAALLFSVISFDVAAAQQPVRDAQAITIFTRVLNVAGGASALAAITDFRASGKITYHGSADATSQDLTVLNRGLHQYRLDVVIAEGTRSLILNGANRTFQKNPDGTSSPFPSQNALKVANVPFPLLQVLNAIQDTSYTISYGGLVTHEGRSTYDILVQKTYPLLHDPMGALGKISKAHIFIDASTFTVQSVEDTAFSRNGLDELSHEVLFSDYRLVNGVLVPFTTDDIISGSKIATIHLTQITFNTGLSDADFN